MINIYLNLSIYFFFFLCLSAFLLFYLNNKARIAMMWFEFRRKIWMTIGLGGFFMILYLGGIFWLSYGLSAEAKQDVFHFIYQSPVDLIYSGLWIFACTTLIIYLVRMAIKFCYLLKGKDF